VFFAALVVAGCRSAAPPEKKVPLVGWRPIGKFSGNSTTQTESFYIEGTQWRIKWETKQTAPEEGSFALEVHSGVSGRPLGDVAVQHSGTGKGIAYVNEEPRLFQLNIESSGVDWTLAVEEAVVSQ
jgi:hypothetical protein